MASASAAAFACAVCGAREASPNQDDELVCDVCGTLSQLTVAESHGYDDALSGGHIARAGRGNVVRAGLGVGRAGGAAAAVGDGGISKTTTGGGVDEKKGPPTSVASLREATRACLLAYQTILKGLGEALIATVGGPRQPFLQALEELWFHYLDVWRAKGRYPIAYCFLGGRGGIGRFLQAYGALPEVQALRSRTHRKARGAAAATASALASMGALGSGGADSGASAESEEEESESYADGGDSDDDESVQPPPPQQQQQQQGRARKRRREGEGGGEGGGGGVDLSSDAFLTMPMLLAFLDLTAQRLRLGHILPYRLSRWCEEGAVPYLQAWGLLPTELQAPLRRLQGPLFFFRTTAQRLPTPHDTHRNNARLVAGLGLERTPPNVPLMAYALLQDMGFLPPTSTPSASEPSSSSSSSDNGAERGGGGRGEAVLDCCLRFWARAQREAASLTGTGSRSRQARQGWWSKFLREMGDDPAVLFAVVLLSLRLTGGWEACDWANPLTRHQQPAAKRQEAPDSFTAAGQAAAPAPLLLPHSLEGLCALSAAEAAREDGGYPRWYRRVVLGNPPPSGPREGGEGEESAEAMTGGLWGAEHSRVLKTLASASSDSQGAVLPFLPSTVKRPPTQPLSGAAEGEEEEEEKDEEGEWAAVLPTVPIDREKSVLAATLPQQQRAGSAPSMAGKVPYVVYAPEDETGLVHDHLWALLERGAGLLQVPPAYLLRHVLTLDHHLFPPKSSRRAPGPLQNEWWDAEVSHLLLNARREGRAMQQKEEARERKRRRKGQGEGEEGDGYKGEEI